MQQAQVCGTGETMISGKTDVVSPFATDPVLLDFLKPYTLEHLFRKFNIILHRLFCNLFLFSNL